jgi:hypothetical protein
MLNPEQIFSSLGIEIVYLYSLNAPTTARKAAAARVARKAYEKRKTRADQAAQTAADAEVCAP